MSKMLMGQIDHARNRIRSLTTEKLGERPTYPEVPTADDFKKGVKNGDITVTPTLLKAAILGWANKTGRLTVTGTTSRWVDGSYVSSGGGQIKPTHVGDLDDYLSYEYYRTIYEAGVAKFDVEFTEFERRRKIIEGRAVEVEDSIVLGDNAAALVALQSFAAFSVV